MASSSAEKKKKAEPALEDKEEEEEEEESKEAADFEEEKVIRKSAGRRIPTIKSEELESDEELEKPANQVKNEKKTEEERAKEERAKEERAADKEKEKAGQKRIDEENAKEKKEATKIEQIEGSDDSDEYDEEDIISDPEYRMDVDWIKEVSDLIKVQKAKDGQLEALIKWNDGMLALYSHGNWVTAIATTSEAPDMVLSASRDKTIIVWNLTRDEVNYGVPRKSLVGHSHFIEDLAISSDGQFALSASWDHTLRLWDLNSGNTTRRFVGHTNDVLSVSFSADNRQIVSGSRDKSIKLWNTLGECKYNITEDGHSEWVSCVRFSPNPATPVIVSGGWDKIVKVWDLTKLKLRTNFIGHNGNVNTVTISPDGSLCASAGKDGVVMLWDLAEAKHLYSLEANAPVNALTFSPNRYWLCAATANGIKIWDLETKSIVDELRPEFAQLGKRKNPDPECLSVAWSADGATLFSGYTDNIIRVWQVTRTL
ncbi:hypothetical protein G6F45_011144 [Rhizopus arrhizus]|nr:hypothetical protein G6F52_005684 [Rhizopus delemar]KAG1535141.1 hypothetical protein G6F51_011700 [Rhizopus arrhizus]KAG1567216.1 hypothetical protein G6F50_008411 [Rhizopus delemar]KAG1578774.1 hypothetical protein G6F48_011669 [Rhizopus delemar]KAG1622381.1 hypothetical protein G6F45_011144 [Rhizopus arrhizus]